MMQIELLLECIEHKLNFEEIKNILGIDIEIDTWMQYLTEREQSNVNALRKHLHSMDVMTYIFKSKLNTLQRNAFINQIFAYPVLLYFLSLNLLSFVIMSLIPTTYSSLQVLNRNHSSILMNFLQFFIGFEWGILILLLYLLIHKQKLPHFKMYTSMYARRMNNLFTLWQSHTFVSNLHQFNRHAIPLHTVITILSENASVIQRTIALNIKIKLEQGIPLKDAFVYLDDRFRYTLGIEDFERKIDDRIEQYLHILEKQIRYHLRRYAGIFSAFVYGHIALMVILVYSTLLYPLQILEEIL